MTLLLLAGTGEARRLAASAEGRAVIASLAGVTRRPKPLGVPTRVGGFGGAEGFKTFLKDESISAILDATHPYAAHMPRRTAAISAERGLPYLRFLRAPWQPQPGDTWLQIDTLAEAAEHLPPHSTVFLATGGQTAPPDALRSHTLWLRRVDDTGPAPWPKGGVLHGLPSDDPDIEIQLLKDHRITHIIAKNSGGPMGYAKLEAARALNLPVFMLRRPPAPDAPTTDTLKTAESFLHTHAPR